MLSEGAGDTPTNPHEPGNPGNEKNAEMAQQTSVHFEPVKGGSEEHNKREKDLPYVRKDLSSNNEYWEADTQHARKAWIEANTKEKTGRRLQAKATPIREAVVVIKPDTSMEDLKRLADSFRKEFGIDVFQIAIHRDEGHPRGKEFRLNLHAHMVADWTDHATGRSLKLGREDMSRMQTIAAEVLHMDRGVSSERKHLNAVQFKIAAEEERLQAVSVKREAKEKFAGIFGQSSKDKTIEAQKSQIKALQDDLTAERQNRKAEEEKSRQNAKNAASRLSMAMTKEKTMARDMEAMRKQMAVMEAKLSAVERIEKAFRVCCKWAADCARGKAVWAWVNESFNNLCRAKGLNEQWTNGRLSVAADVWLAVVDPDNDGQAFGKFTEQQQQELHERLTEAATRPELGQGRGRSV